MLDVGPEIEELERRAYQIVGMICGGAVADRAIDAAIAELQAETVSTFPEKPDTFDQLYARRFRRLRRWFQPHAELFESATA